MATILDSTVLYGVCNQNGIKVKLIVKKNKAEELNSCA